MANLFAELKRRNIYRVGAAYAVVAWVLLQLVANVAPILDLPPWIARTVLLLLIIGFPVALVFAWVHQLAPESGPLMRVTTGKLDWALMAALLVVIALVSYEQLAPTRTAESQQTGVEAARAASTARVGAISIAVLPFANMSGDSGQEFFSDGMTEEITSALAKVPDLRVVGRTSAFQFKGNNQDLRTIGQSLAATHLIEGSVRKAGDRVRITVQLIRADDGTHIWAEDYDRQLTDIFAIQEDIARTIVSSLRMPLGLKPGENLINNRNIDPDSYAQYLRAKALLLARGARIKDATALLEQIVAKNPNYAPAWAVLARAYVLTRDRDFYAKSQAAAQRALSLDPNNADGNYALAILQADTSFLGYYELVQRALILDPNNPDILHGFALRMATVGYVKEVLAIRQKLLELEPSFEANFSHASVALWLNGQTDAAIALAKALPPGRPPALAVIYASMGRYNDAADALEKSGRNDPPAVLAEAVRLLRLAPAKPASPQSLPALGELSWVFLHAGAPERVLEDARPQIGGNLTTKVIWHPSFAAVRKTEAFKAYARKWHFVEFWRAKGWPPQCHPTTGDDFVCT